MLLIRSWLVAAVQVITDLVGPRTVYRNRLGTGNLLRAALLDAVTVGVLCTRGESGKIRGIAPIQGQFDYARLIDHLRDHGIHRIDLRGACLYRDYLCRMSEL